ncbi:response regulator [Epilithonimonas caeni]|uniref:response regulator n=1 Tax=Epilithonimonas caeni TaxID=365343 RepID=UPI00040F0513|nr:response regulator transcription factor [Epilithonimonas caeni]
MNISKQTVLLVDDHSIVRKGVYLLIKKYFGDPTVFDVASINEAISIVKNNSVNYIILDINFPEGNSLTFVEYLRSINNDEIKILIFSALDENIYAFKYIKAGANGFLSKLTEEHQLVYALGRFFENGKYISEELKDRLLENMVRNKSVNDLDTLSVRELEIARLLAYGYSNTFIASSLNIQKSTVSTYKMRIFEKLGINNIPALVEILKIN